MTIHLGLPDLQLIGLDIKCTSASLSRHGVLYFSFVFLHCSVWSLSFSAVSIFGSGAKYPVITVSVCS